MSGRIGALVRLTAGALVLFLLLIQPNHPEAMTWDALRLFPLELPLILLALLALPPRGTPTLAVRAGLVAALVLLALLKVADVATFLTYNRSFNPVVDLHLVVALWRLGSGAVGVPLALAGVLAALLAVALTTWLAWWATGVWARVRPPVPWRAAAWVGAAAAGIVAVADVGQARRLWSLPLDPPGAAFSARLATQRVAQARESARQLRAFTQVAAMDRHAGRTGLFDRLGGRDIVFIYIESYGRASFDVPYYANRHRATLQAAEEALAEAGLAARSGWLTAPMVGGQSWLAHASVASGLWIPDQRRYRALLASPRQTLFDLAAASGYHAAAIMPALTYDWPEGTQMGFETILSSTDLGYRGPPFNWVTMPDQFTLTAFDRLLRDRPERRPLFAQIALISSHAPWTPIPDLVPWDEVGDGSVFTRWEDAGDPPEVVWQDRERVRFQYREAIDYSLQAALSYAARTDGPLLVILGDHQTASSISLSDSFDVAVHVIGPPAALDPIEGWGWTPGLIPDAELEPWPMDAFRDRFVASYSSDAGAPGTEAPDG